MREIPEGDRAYSRKLPYMVAGGILLLVALGLVVAGREHWYWIVGAAISGVVLILLGEFAARRG